MVAWAGAIASSGASMTVVSMRQHVAGLVAAATGIAFLCLSVTGRPSPNSAAFSAIRRRGRRPAFRASSSSSSQQRAPQQQNPRRFHSRSVSPSSRRHRPQPQRLPPGPPPSARVAPDAVESEPLPPPGAAQPAGLPPGVKPPRGSPQPANTGPQPGDEIVSAPPVQKIPNQQAVFSGLDKITGRIINFEVALGETVQFGALQVVPRVCYTRPPTEAAATDAFIEVSEVTLQGEVRRIFAGWMFAASPGLNAVEHPIYDVWLTDCKQPPVKVAEDPGPGANVGADQPPPAGRARATTAAGSATGRSSAPRAAAGPAAAAAQPARPRPPQQQQQPQFNRAFPAPIR